MKKFFKSFIYAFKGIYCSIHKQRNIKVQLIIGILVILWSLLIHIPRDKFLIILFICFFVIIMEMINTAMEKLINILSPKYNKKYGMIKDIMAGAVLLSAILSVILGLYILYKPSLLFITDLLK